MAVKHLLMVSAKLVLPLGIVWLWLLLACTKNNDLPQIIDTHTPQPPFTYLALGDSYTIGHGVLPDLRFPAQLVQQMNQLGAPFDPPRFIAKTGWTTYSLTGVLNATNFADTTFSLVSLLIGVNNLYQNRPIEEYAIQFEQLLLRAIALAGNNTARVVVLSIPDYGYTPFGVYNQPAISQKTDQFNAVNKQITLSYGVQYIDITPISRQGLEQPELVAPDNLHPSGNMYALWVDLITEAIKAKYVSTP